MSHQAYHEELSSALHYVPLTVTSEAFTEEGEIPHRYTCDGAGVSPPLHIGGLPEGTQSLAIIVDDPDAPVGTWVHWLAWNMPATQLLKEDVHPPVQGRNDFGDNRYGGPCPPRGPAHHYHFKVYALGTQLGLGEGARKIELERAMGSHIIGFGELVGLYQRK
ncbi:YbhB/YbcL family Raf kinase inhibitor-like protein [Flavihumibacter rivuli]|uniref:YbhB/YbcL family Raf kinase inhibitor-like protein n=1 Tax=Flavihumibacter rivuli TaxID=2838156 RepID=UPI001BDE5CF9|nr:YbhB/YbcL family Raf kinase inhibitor-like protein [Flavihumibacter rivuli]ULQ57753.1 YbhB/YbcL family Raf kinase inhibitor-like protein [Flavihumibacter rivuli]